MPNVCNVTIQGPARSAAVPVPMDTPISQLIPQFLELTVDNFDQPDVAKTVWSVARNGQPPLPLDRTLRDAGVAEGEVLTLTTVRPAAQAPPRPADAHRPRPRHGTLRSRTQAVLPERLAGLDRVARAINAFFDQEQPEPTVLESAPPPQPSMREQLTRERDPSALSRSRASWRRSDYLERLDRRMAEPQLMKCVTIAVLSPKGGVGKTTLTALLGSLLAQKRSDRTLALDTNPDFGSLGRTLVPDHNVFVDDLREALDRPDMTAATLDGHLGRAFGGLMVLPAPTDPERMKSLDEEAYRTVIARLKQFVGVLVLDCGTELQSDAARAAQDAADQIVLVSDAHPAAASLVAESASLLTQIGPPITLVVNKMPKRKRSLEIDLAGFDQLIPDARGLVTIADEPAAAKLVASGRFDWRDAPRDWRRSVRELALVLISDWVDVSVAR